MQSKINETPVPDSVSAVHNATNATRDAESEFDAGQEGKIREIVMDNVESEPVVFSFANNGHLLRTHMHKTTHMYMRVHCLFIFANSASTHMKLLN